MFAMSHVHLELMIFISFCSISRIHACWLLCRMELEIIAITGTLRRAWKCKQFIMRLTLTVKFSYKTFFSFYRNRQLNRTQISWIISAFPLGVVIVSLALYQCYYWIGTKLSMLAASFMILLSWGLMLPDG